MRLRLVLVSLAALTAVAGCTPDAGSDVPEEVTGVVTKVQSSGLTEVEQFTVRTESGELYDIRVDEETELAFPPAHLNEHRVSGEPVVVELENRSGTLYATLVDDA